MKPEFVHVTYGVLFKGTRLFVAKIAYGIQNVKGCLFRKDGFKLYHRKGKLWLQMPHKMFQGRRLRRFLRNYVKKIGGLPRSLDHWVVPYK